MAEAQAKASVEGRNWPVAHTWSLLAPVLQAADRISVVSERQRYATIGELGAAGRLTAETCGYEFTAVIPCALVPIDETPPRAPGPREGMVRGRLVPEGAFVVLWSGGFNVWSDVLTLARGLEGAMDREPRLHFVATGGAVPGLDSSTWERFRELVLRSPHRERFHLEGWVTGDRVAGYVEEADLGVLADRMVYEGLLGSKNRVLQWMGAGLPVLNRLGDLRHPRRSRLGHSPRGLGRSRGPRLGRRPMKLPDAAGPARSRSGSSPSKPRPARSSSGPMVRVARPTRAPVAACAGPPTTPSGASAPRASSGGSRACAGARRW
jgi:hypothetical protein